MGPIGIFVCIVAAIITLFAWSNVGRR